MSRHIVYPPRRLACALALGVALVVAGCSGSSSTPSATVLPTATPTPSLTWRLVESPPAPEAITSELQGVSAVSPSDVWAVGNFRYLSPHANLSLPGKNPLIERWDGTAWQFVYGPPTDILHDVAVVSANDIWAVGGEINFGNTASVVYTPLIEHWNGVEWAVVPPPDAHSSVLQLTSVAAISANDVWAVGERTNNQFMAQPLIERWDGKVWSVVDNPAQPANTETSLSAITAIPGTNQLWALGESWSQKSNSGQALIERWNGSAWQIIANPALPSGAKDLRLNGVVALSATDAWAVGGYTASDKTQKAYVAHWDGTSWKVVSSPDVTGGLVGVAAANANDVRAVGSTTSSTGTTVPLIEQWNGLAWQVATSPTPSGAGSSSLSDVTSDGAGGFWAVGSYADSNKNAQAFIERCP